MARSRETVTPLFVDLDGTLVRTDTLHESALLHVRENLRGLVDLATWLARGRAALKRRLFEVGSTPRVDLLPYRESVLEFLRESKSEGRPVILVTAADGLMAERVAEHVGVFDMVLGSDGHRNLKGGIKLDAIRTICEERGWHRFGYIGDSVADMPIWRASSEAYVVGASPRTMRRLSAVKEPEAVIEPPMRPGLALLRLLRPHQWSKNVLLFVPLILAHEWNDLERLGAALAGFVAFCLAASAMYVTNDALDIESDRQHARKRERPFAAGTVPLAASPAIALALLAAAAAISLTMLPPSFSALLLCYLSLTLAYSFWLKKRLLVDVFALASLYGLRLIGGGYATGTEVTEWLVAFAGFLFTSLAFAKRYTEVAAQADLGREDVSGRAYHVSDLSVMESVGPASGYLAVLVLALYINSDRVAALYVNPVALWLICPLLLYWLTRLWFLARRRQLHHDPLVFALTDRISLLTGAISALFVIVAMKGWGPSLP